MITKKMAVGSETPTTAIYELEDSTYQSKIRVILALFIDGKRLNRFDAERYHDHCLHSTVSALERMGIAIEREWETVPCLGGKKTVRCKRYWLCEHAENVARARRILKARGGTS